MMGSCRTRGVGLVAVIATALIASACGSSSSPPSTTAPSTANAHDLRLGQTGQITYSVHNVAGTFNLSVTAKNLNNDPTVLNPVSTSTGAVPPAPGTRWLSVNLSMRADDSHNYQGSISDIALSGSDGRTYADHPEVTVPDESPESAFYQVPPKSTVTNVVIFDVPDGVSPQRLRFHDSSATHPNPADYLAWNLGS
jgi:hypothetical protein